jgi:hypothetical protein
MDVKVVVTITPDELNQAVIALFKAQGTPLPASADLSVIVGKTPSVIVTPDVPPPKSSPVFVSSVTCLATIFGLNYDGSIDASDNGEGAFKDPATGKPYNTRIKELVGCSIPEQILFATTGSKDYEGVSTGKYKVNVASLLTGKSLQGVSIVDLGPGQGGKLIPDRYFDQTFGLALALGHHDNARVTYSIIGPDGNPLSIKGL